MLPRVWVKNRRGALVAFVALLLSALSGCCCNVSFGCGPDTCTGCCDSSDRCVVPGRVGPAQCGSGGGACLACAAGQSCGAGACSASSDAGPADAGAADAGPSKCVAAPGIEPGLDRSYSGDNSNAVNRFHGSCIFPYYSDSVPDTVYRLALAQRSFVEVRTTDSDYAGGLYLRDGCEGPELQCNVAAWPFYSNARVALVVDAGTYFVFVERDAEYALSTTTLPVMAAAGNDGCASALPLGGAPGVFVQGDTTGMADRFGASCEMPHDAGTPDALFRLDLPARSDVMISAAAGYLPLVSVRSGSCDGGEVACDSAGALRLRLDAGSYWVVLSGAGIAFTEPDGGTSSSVPPYGPYALRVELRDGG
ncbi:MAG: hypothetical protein ACYC8T_26095 [Myxococcaceae bacterium]